MRHENYVQILQVHSKSHVDLLNESSDEMNRTLSKQVSETKRSKKVKKVSNDLDLDMEPIQEVEKEEEEEEEEIANVINVNVIILHSESSFLLHDCLATKAESCLELDKLEDEVDFARRPSLLLSMPSVGK